MSRVPLVLAVGWLVSLAAGCVQWPQQVADMPERSIRSEPAKAMRHRMVPWGSSVQGRPLEMHLFGDFGAGQRPVLIIGAVHGNEPTSATVAEGLIEHLHEHPDVYAERPVAILPVANPDGLAAETRGNANGVDVNRNFPAANWEPLTGRSNFNGHAPATEPETIAIMRAIEELDPMRLVSIHSIRRGRHCNNYDGPSETLALLMTAHNGYPATPTIGYPTPGSLGSWAGIDLQIPMVTLELPRDQDGEGAWQDNREALVAFITAPLTDEEKRAR